MPRGIKAAPAFLDSTSFVKSVERTCKTRKLRLTRVRAQVLRLIANSDKPIKAYSLLELMNLEAELVVDVSIAPITVYRALNFLQSNGFIRKLVSINAFVPSMYPVDQRLIYFLCLQCSSATEIYNEEMLHTIDDQAKELSFEPETQSIEVRGNCDKCRLKLRKRHLGLRR